MKYALILLLASCSWGPWAKDNEKEGPSVAEETRSELNDRINLYCSLSKPTYEQHLAIGDSCDAALFTSLHGVVCDYVEVAQFEDSENDGKLCRRPDCSCYPDRSPSEFSKDMATGFQLYQTLRPNPGLIDRIVEYGEKNNWVVCEAEDAATTLSRCLMSPKIVGRWYDIQSKSITLVEESEDAVGLPTDFAAHLQVVGVLTEGSLYGGISDGSLKNLAAQAAREPNNFLFQAADVRYNKGGEDVATAIGQALLAKFPADRLPTSSDWCSPYIYERDEYRGDELNKDWLPCPEEGLEHDGTDFLLAAWVLLHD